MNTCAFWLSIWILPHIRLFAEKIHPITNMCASVKVAHIMKYQPYAILNEQPTASAMQPLKIW